MPDLLVPPGATLLHVGPAKTGTTALQNALHRVREDLRQYGVVYPGKTTKLFCLSIAAGLEQRKSDEWYDLLAELEATMEERVCLSYEDFGMLDSVRIGRVVESVGGPRPHVLFVARRLDVVLPSFWQQSLKRGVTAPYEEWLESALDGSEDGLLRRAYRTQGTTGAVERWADAVGPENVTVMIADEGDRRLLLRTVEELLGLPDGLLRPPRGKAANRSMTLHEAEMVRTITLAGAQHEVDPALLQQMRNKVSRAFTGVDPSPAAPLISPLPAWAHERVRELSETRANRLTGLGVRVIGNPDELRIAEPSVLDDAVESPDQLCRETVELAVATMLQLARDEQHATPRPHRSGWRRRLRRRSRS